MGVGAVSVNEVSVADPDQRIPSAGQEPPSWKAGARDLRGRGRRGRWMFLLKDNAILLLPAGFAVATLFVGAVPLMAEMVGGMSERMVSRVGVLLEGMAGALLAFGIGVAVITLMRQEVHHREMMDDKILTPTDVNIRIDQVPEGREDG